VHLIANPSNNYTKDHGEKTVSNAEPVSSKSQVAISTDSPRQSTENLSITDITNEIRHLKEENRRLKEAVIAKTDQQGQADDGASSHANNTSINNKSMVDSDKLNMRLKAMFKERIACFREAVYLLTGFKV
jgi:hypothetical protein